MLLIVGMKLELPDWAINSAKVNRLSGAPACSQTNPFFFANGTRSRGAENNVIRCKYLGMVPMRLLSNKDPKESHRPEGEAGKMRRQATFAVAFVVGLVIILSGLAGLH